MERDACLQSLPLYIFRVSSKGTLLHGFPRRAPTDTQFPEPRFICVSESPINKPPPRSPLGPLWREMLVSRVFFYISPGVPKTWSPDKTKSHLFSMLPVKEPPLCVPPLRSLQREMLCLQSQWFILSFISLSVLS
jgi:hypothetical protein